MAVLPPDHLPIRSIEFHYGSYCPPNARCLRAQPNEGIVVFRMKGRGPDLWVSVFVDEKGVVHASTFEPFPPGSA